MPAKTSPWVVVAGTAIGAALAIISICAVVIIVTLTVHIVRVLG